MKPLLRRGFPAFRSRFLIFFGSNRCGVDGWVVSFPGSAYYCQFGASLVIALPSFPLQSILQQSVRLTPELTGEDWIFIVTPHRAGPQTAMSPSEDDKDLELRRQRQIEAGDVLKTYPGFAKAQVQTVDEILAFYERDPAAEDTPYRSEERQWFCLRMLDIRADALIEILPKDDIKAHEAFVVALQATRDSLWETWSGLPLWAMFNIGQDWRQVFDRRIGLWAVEGYRRMAGMLPSESRSQSLIQPAPSMCAGVDEISRRESLLKEYLAVTKVSEYFIYMHAKSGIHKPQFLKWKKGELSRDSATTENFERFLREKIVPPPRREKR